MKKKKVLMAAAAGAAVLAIVIAVSVNGRNGEEKNGDQSAVSGSVISGSSTEGGSADSGGSRNETKEENIPENPSDDGTEGDAGSFAGSAGGDSSAGGKNTVPGEGISFPYNIPGTSLTVQNLSSYEGIFLEDGSDQEVSNVAAVVLKNSGDTNVEYASVSLIGESQTFQFDVSDLPAGCTAVAQEKNKSSYQEGIWTDCTATVAELEEFGMAEDQVKVEETGDQTLTVTNLTDRDIPAVRIFYKFYMEDEDTYVGGITYTAKITGLAAGESRSVTPSHYVRGSSRIMMVRTYDTADE